MRGVGERDVEAAEHGLRVGHFLFAGGDAGVVRIRAAFFTDVGQSFGLDGEAVDFIAVLFHHRRQVGFVEVVGRERVVGGADAVLQGEIQAGRGFAAARYAHQDYVGIFQVFVADAVVVVEGEVYRFHAGIVAGGVGDAVIASDFVAGLGAQFFFQYAEEGIEKTQVQARAVADDVADFFVDDAGENQRPHGGLIGGGFNDFYHRTGFVRRIDEGVGGAFEFHFLKLVEQGFAHALGSQAGAVGNKKGVSARHNDAALFRCLIWKTGADDSKMPSEIEVRDGCYIALHEILVKYNLAIKFLFNFFIGIKFLCCA